ncbi:MULTISPECIES: hypothetical protein [Streptomyces]|nr:hypothetical protein OG855_04985 [Streptomyces anthocyanicus]
MLSLEDEGVHHAVLGVTRLHDLALMDGKEIARPGNLQESV